MDAKRPALPEMKLPPLPTPGQGQSKPRPVEPHAGKYHACSVKSNQSLSVVHLAGLLTPTMPFPPQAPPGPMGFGQPRPPLMGYVGMTYDTLLLAFGLDSWKRADSIPSSTGAPPYPPNQYGGGGAGGGGGSGRGNYDNFRGQGGYLGKPRNIR